MTEPPADLPPPPPDRLADVGHQRYAWLGGGWRSRGHQENCELAAELRRNDEASRPDPEV